MDKKRFAEIMIGVANNYNAKISEQFIDMAYRLAIEDGFTIKQWEDAARRIMRTYVYNNMPNYAVFYKAINGTDQSKAEQQAGLIIDAIRQGKNITFNDPVTKRLMATRWTIDRLRQNLKESDEKWFIKDFKGAYIAYANTANAIREIEDKTPKQIKGMCEQIGNL